MSAKAAFYDVDGTLVRTNIVHAYAYYAMNRGSLTGIAARTLATVAQIPVYAGLDLLNRKVFNEYFYRAYAGLSEDRLVVLGEDLFEDVLKPAIFPKAQDLIDEARRILGWVPRIEARTSIARSAAWYQARGWL